MKEIDLGEFEVKSGEVVVSDPCYKMPTRCRGVLKKVRKGRWYALAHVSDEGVWGWQPLTENLQKSTNT